MQALSTRTTRSRRTLRAPEANATAFVMGEGAGAPILRGEMLAPGVRKSIASYLWRRFCRRFYHFAAPPEGMAR